MLVRRLILILSLFLLTGCENGFQRMNAGEYGVVFSAIPPILGGGVQEKSLEPGKMAFIFPWETLYRVNTTLQSMGWGGVGEGDNNLTEDFIETRTSDGNEVGLAITILYHIDPSKVTYVVQSVAPDGKQLRNIVGAVARSDIRTQMNVLSTSEFFDHALRDQQLNAIKKAMNDRLNKEGIIIDDVIYTAHRFERALGDGKFDRSYQEKIDLTKAVEEETKKEKKRVATIIEQKNKEYNEALGAVNRSLEEAIGKKEEAKLFGDSYLSAKKTEADMILTKGQEEIEGLKKRVAALSGPGGEALLRMEFVKHLMKTNPKFMLLESSQKGNGIDISKMDTNELIRQMGILTAVSETPQTRKEENEKEKK